ncbi:MAG: hypothetical protein KFB97_13210 [Cyanobium sp. M30B3]|nr:MAG: hypothetical protein KFB97_13210 [Cyanobium sp. M30B3]
MLVAVVIMGIAAGAIVQASNIAFSASKRSNSGSEIQNVVSRDLNWLRWYGNAWNCEAGSYSTCTTSSPNSVLRYSTTQECSTLVEDFLKDAASFDRTDLPRPFPIPSTAGTAQALEEINGTQLTRTIRLPSGAVDSAQSRSVEVIYNYAGQPAVDRFASVLIQAGGWCDPGQPT